MKILLTAFDPFGGHGVNPALEAIKRIGSQVAGVQVEKVEIPTVFGSAIRTAEEAIQRSQPDAVLCIGLAGGSSALSVERVAINIDDACIPDNEGKQPIDEPIASDGPAALFSTLPIKGMVCTIRKAGLPAEVSNSAGTFVCNHLMYGVLYYIQRNMLDIRAGFMHVPCTPQLTVDQPERPSMALDDIVRGIEAAIQAIASFDADLKVGGGALY